MRGKIILTTDASGAVAAARERLVVVVDIIDMSTTAEAVYEAGAAAVYGGIPDGARLPATLAGVVPNPGELARGVGEAVAAAGWELLLITEPRVGPQSEREANVAQTLAGLAQAGVTPAAILPNLGAETVKLADFRQRAALIVSATGGVALAAAAAQSPWAWRGVTTATVARTLHSRGREPALRGARRALRRAQELGAGIAVAAASANSLEDILAAEYIYHLLLELVMAGEE